MNYGYGTWQVLTGLKLGGHDMSERWSGKAADWLLSVQPSDGSFGATCASYDAAKLTGVGDSTASQPARGAMGLIAVLGANHPAVERSIQWLIDTQTPEGTWEETNYTGTGFPRVFYLKYHYYRLYFPLTALARFRRLRV